MFGSMSIIAGLLTFLNPDTKGIQLRTSLDEAERFYNENAKVLKKIGYINPAYKNEWV